MSTSSVPYVGPVRNNDGSLPGDPAVGGALELHAAAATVNAVVRLILKAMSRAVRLIDGEPLLVASSGESVGLHAPPRFGRRLLSATCRRKKMTG